MKLIIDYALSFLGMPYKWGGESIDGMDCSGFVQEILRAAGEDPAGDQTAQDLYNHFDHKGTHGSFSPGALCFFGESTTKVTHVAFLLDPYLMIEAGGGDSSVKTKEDAIKKRAWVRIRPVKSRKDFLGTIRPMYNKIGVM